MQILRRLLIVALYYLQNRYLQFIPSVSDYSTGDIHIYDLDTNQFQLIHKLGTDIIDDLMSIKVGPDGTIWLVSTNASKLYKILPP